MLEELTLRLSIVYLKDW